MRSRAFREGSVGILIILGLGSLVAVIAWLRGLSFGRQAYSMTVELPNALGLSVGNPVQYRGVKVGKVTALQPGVNSVLADLEIRPTSLLIPKNSTVEVTESGFIGQVEISITPQARLASSAIATLSPVESDCPSDLIVCDGDRLDGAVGANFDELIVATTHLAELFSESGVIDSTNETLKSFTSVANNLNRLSRNANRTLRDVSVAANSFSGLSQDAKVQLAQLGTAADSVSQAAEQVETIGADVGKTAGDISNAAQEVTAFVQTNRGTLVATLDNLLETSEELKVTLQGVGPIVSRVEKGQLLTNLETLAENGAKASADLKQLTSTVNSPITILGLAQTLDSARVTFQNTQKITTDLEQITGNPELRQNLIKLINGLSELLSSTQDLDRQLAQLQAPSLSSETALSITASPPLDWTPSSTGIFTPLPPAFHANHQP